MSFQEKIRILENLNWIPKSWLLLNSKDFLDEINGCIDEYYVNKCVNIWKICRTQQLFLKWPVYNVIKSQAGQRSIQSARWTNRFFRYGVAQKIHWQCSDSTPQLTLKNIFLKKKKRGKGGKKRIYHLLSLDILKNIYNYMKKTLKYPTFSLLCICV